MKKNSIPNQPPAEPDIEKSIIVSCLFDNELCRQAVESLDPDHFYFSANKIIFEKIKELKSNGHLVGIAEVWSALDEKHQQIVGSASKLSALIDTHPVSVDLKFHISKLKEAAARRRILELVNSIQKKCYRKGSDLKKIDIDARLIDEAIQGSKTDRSLFQFVHNAWILENLKPVEWRIHSIMENNSFYYDFGEPGGYKTFVEIDRLLHIASGKDYHGHSVKQGTVFYIAGEGQQGIGRRIAAWHIHHGTKAKDVPLFVAKTPTRLMDLDAVDKVKRAVDAMVTEYGPPAIIHIDTLARNFGDGDENATQDMNRVISNLDEAFGTYVGRGLTHHTGHANKERARGSIALHGAADSAFRIRYMQDGTVLVECKKMKDAPPAPPMLFRRKEIKLLIGDQHDSSFILELESEGQDVCILPETNRKKASGNMQGAIDLLNQMYALCEKNLAADGRTGQMPHISKKDWSQACIQSEIYKRADNFERAIKSMFNRGFLRFDESGYYVYPIEIYTKYKSDDFETEEN
jgi:hypothetical protein